MQVVFKEFYELASLYFSYHVTSEQNTSPEPEMVYWQRLTANPDRPHKVLCQTGFCSVHRLQQCLQWDKMSHICVWFRRETKMGNEWLLEICTFDMLIAAADHIRHKSCDEKVDKNSKNYKNILIFRWNFSFCSKTKRTIGKFGSDSAASECFAHCRGKIQRRCMHELKWNKQSINRYNQSYQS